MLKPSHLSILCFLLLNIGLGSPSSSEEEDDENFTLINKSGVLDDSLLLNPTKIKELKILNCDFRPISIDAFKSMPNLKKIIIQNSNIDKLPEGVLQISSKLEEIKIKGTKIHNYDSGTFMNLTKLEEFEIFNSDIGDFKNSMFSGCTKLEEFECNQCGIQTINSEAFTGINLKELKLKDNNIKEFSFNNFPKMSKLSSINLSGNPLITIDLTGVKENCPNLKKIKVKKTNVSLETVKEIEALDIKVKRED